MHWPRLTPQLLLICLGIAAPAAAHPPYVFSWPFIDAEELEVRGGTTRGPEVVLDRAPSDAWRALEDARGDRFEQDRRAILAMAGGFRTSFDFLETIVFTPDGRPASPYRSWATEKVYVVEDRGGFIRLQHVIVAFYVNDAGEARGPFVQKHWRQDWRYQPRHIVEYQGSGVWQRREVSRAERRGQWSQSVYNVDDRPRYASIGRWSHGPSFSAWNGGTTRRPLPRREHTVRDDYDVLLGNNRRLILPTGWVHQQRNLKTVLPAPGSGEPVTHLAEEIGINRYQRIRDFDFSAADAYWQASAPLWALVRTAWRQRFEANTTIGIASRCDGEPAFAGFFALAEAYAADAEPDPDAYVARVDALIDCIASPPARTSATSSR